MKEETSRAFEEWWDENYPCGSKMGSATEIKPTKDGIKVKISHKWEFYKVWKAGTLHCKSQGAISWPSEEEVNAKIQSLFPYEIIRNGTDNPHWCWANCGQLLNWLRERATTGPGEGTK